MQDKTGSWLDRCLAPDLFRRQPQAGARTPSTISRIRRYSSGTTRRMAASPTATATKTLLVLVAAASSLGAVSAFGFGGRASSPLTGPAQARATGISVGGGGTRRNSQQTVAMTARPSQVFVAGATGRLGQRVVRYVSATVHQRAGLACRPLKRVRWLSMVFRLKS